MRFFLDVAFNDGMDQFRLSPAQINERIKQMNGDACIAISLVDPIH